MKKLALLVTLSALAACGPTPTEVPSEMDAPPVAMNETSQDAMQNRCYGSIVSGIASTWPYASTREAFPPPPGALALWVQTFLPEGTTVRGLQELFCG